MGDWQEIIGSPIPENPTTSSINEVEEAIEAWDLETEALIRDICKSINPNQTVPKTILRKFKRRK